MLGREWEVRGRESVVAGREEDGRPVSVLMRDMAGREASARNAPCRALILVSSSRERDIL